jgi:hypothetical protein
MRSNGRGGKSAAILAKSDLRKIGEKYIKGITAAGDNLKQYAKPKALQAEGKKVAGQVGDEATVLAGTVHNILDNPKTHQALTSLTGSLVKALAEGGKVVAGTALTAVKTSGPAAGEGVEAAVFAGEDVAADAAAGVVGIIPEVGDVGAELIEGGTQASQVATIALGSAIQGAIAGTKTAEQFGHLVGRSLGDLTGLGNKALDARDQLQAIANDAFAEAKAAPQSGGKKRTRRRTRRRTGRRTRRRARRRAKRRTRRRARRKIRRRRRGGAEKNAEEIANEARAARDRARLDDQNQPINPVVRALRREQRQRANARADALRAAAAAAAQQRGDERANEAQRGGRTRRRAKRRSRRR